MAIGAMVNMMAGLFKKIKLAHGLGNFLFWGECGRVSGRKKTTQKTMKAPKTAPN